MRDTLMLLYSCRTSPSLSPEHVKPSESSGPDCLASPISAQAPLLVGLGCWATVVTCDHWEAGLHLSSSQMLRCQATRAVLIERQEVWVHWDLYFQNTMVAQARTLTISGSLHK